MEQAAIYADSADVISISHSSFIGNVAYWKAVLSTWVSISFGILRECYDFALCIQ